jgi:hypothetical protein
MTTTFDTTTARRRTQPPGSQVQPLPQAATVRARQRLRWIRRTFVLLLLSSVMLVALATWKRDNRIVALLQQEMQPAARALQASLDNTGALPASPDLPSQTYYLDHSERFYAQRADQPVIVAYRPAKFPEALYLHANGRTVVTLQSGRIQVEWIDEKTLRRRLEQQEESMRSFEERLSEQPLNLP